MTSIVADIGGTNARFAYLEPGKPGLQGIEIFPSANFAYFVEAVQAYLDKVALDKVARACLAVAGPVEGDWIDLPNNHWAFSCDELRDALGM